MRLLFFAFILFLAGCSAPRSASPVSHSRQVKLLSYNIHHANPPSRPDSIDLDAIASVIRAQDADFVTLQEVDRNTARSGKIDEAALLAEKTGYPYYYFAKSIDYDGGEYGVAILSKFKLEQTRTHRLPSLEGTGGEPRVIAMAVVKLAGGQELQLASTHLDAQRSPANKRLQIAEINRLSTQISLPMLIAGDFNATEKDTVISKLDEQFTRTCHNCAFTIPVNHPRRTLDYIAFRPEKRFKVLSHEVINETYASDHLPVLAVLEILD